MFKMKSLSLYVRVNYLKKFEKKIKSNICSTNRNRTFEKPRYMPGHKIGLIIYSKSLFTSRARWQLNHFYRFANIDMTHRRLISHLEFVDIQIVGLHYYLYIHIFLTRNCTNWFFLFVYFSANPGEVFLQDELRGAASACWIDLLEHDNDWNAGNVSTYNNNDM